MPGSATVEVNSSIIGQVDSTHDFSDAVAIEDTDGHLTISGQNNIARQILGFDTVGTINVDPMLGPLAFNGGPTMTHALLDASPAIDTGINPLGLPTDQRGAGNTRAFGEGADIGAFELQSLPAPTLPGDYNRDHIVDTGDYVLWRKTTGTGSPRYAGADGDGSSSIDANDYNVWSNHYGDSEPSGSGGASAISDSPATSETADSPGEVSTVVKSHAAVFATISRAAAMVDDVSANAPRSRRSLAAFSEHSRFDQRGKYLDAALIAQLNRHGTRRKLYRDALLSSASTPTARGADVAF